MAKIPSRHTPDSESKPFLGGGVKFNQVGASLSPDALPEEPVIVTASSTTSDTLRRALIVTILVILTATLYLFSNDSLSGIRHSPGRGGISTAAHSAAPPSNF